MASFSGQVIQQEPIWGAIKNNTFPAVVTPFAFYADPVPPVVTLTSPVSLVDVARNTAITIRITDETQLKSHAIFAKFPNTYGLYEVVFDGMDLQGNVNYTVTRATVTNGYEYTFVRNGGWLSSPVNIIVRASDGNTEV